MAVQAQYPSNVLLLNRNNGQEDHDYSLQPCPGGFLDQSHMFFNNGVSANTRKRGREVAATTTNGIAGASINPFSMQPQPSQLIDLSQLQNHGQANVVSTGLRLSFGDHHHHQQQQQHNRIQQHQPNLISQPPQAYLSLLPADFTTQIKQQRDELDQFLQAQGEQLRRTLADKRQRHYRALLGAAEESVSRRLREKETEVEKASRRNAELEARATQLSMEAQAWQAKAKAQEATAAALQAQLQQAIISGGAAAADMRGGGVEGQAEDAESAYIDPERVELSGPSCKACPERVATVVLLPCRHLCLCTECDRVALACPLCLSTRNSSVEVFLS